MSEPFRGAPPEPSEPWAWPHPCVLGGDLLTAHLAALHEHVLHVPQKLGMWALQHLWGRAGAGCMPSRSGGEAGPSQMVTQHLAGRAVAVKCAPDAPPCPPFLPCPARPASGSQLKLPAAWTFPSTLPPAT